MFLIKMRLSLVLLVLFLVCTLQPVLGFDYFDALEKGLWFFDANRCGRDAGQDNVFSTWRSGCHTGDGDEAGLDLNGGYHDAGDHVMFGLPQYWSAGVLAWTYYEYRELFESRGLAVKYLSVLRYFTDFILRAHPDSGTLYYEKGDGDSDHAYWGPPESQTSPRPLKRADSSNPGSDVCGEAAATLAITSLIYTNIDSSYARQCLTAAREIYAIGTGNLGRCDESPFYTSSSHYDDLAWAAVWLTLATGEGAYSEVVEGYLEFENDYGDDNYAKKWAPAWDDVTIFVLLKMAQISGKSQYYEGVLNNLIWYRDQCPRTAFGLPWLDSWGVLRYASCEAGVGFMAAKLLGWDGYLDTAELTMDYTLGDNPRNSSYLTNYGSNAPQHPHHRANEPNRDGVTNGLIGALVGGPDLDGAYSDDVTNYIMNEVALDYNASFIYGMAGMAYFSSGGAPDPSPVAQGTPPPTPTPVPVQGEIKVLYFCSNPEPLTNQLKPTLNIVNSGSAPVALEELTVRYYFNSEGRSALEAQIDYALMGSTNIIVTLGEGYLDIGFTSAAGSLAAGAQTGEIQVRVNKADWASLDQSDDYSFDPAHSTYAESLFITIQRGGVLIWGAGEPGKIPEPPGTYLLEIYVIDRFPVARPNRGLFVRSTPEGSYFAPGTSVSLRAYDLAIGEALYVFDHWEGDLAGSTNPVSLTVSSARTVTACYRDSGAGPSTAAPTATPTPAGGLIGDVNGSGVVDIIDALMTAQYYVGLEPPGFDPSLADVNRDGNLTIVDALIMAQYYVGLIGSLPV